MFPNRQVVQEEVVAAARSAGFSLAGIVAVDHPSSKRDALRTEKFVAAGRAGEMEYLTRQDEEGRLLRSAVTRPFPWAKSVILCAESYNSEHPRSTDPATPERGWIARYAWSSRVDEKGRRYPSDYHKVLLKRMKQMEADLRSRVGEFEARCFVDTGPLVERNYARAAGLGWIGKNTCLLNQERGSWLFLATIVTSIELSEEQNVDALLPPDRCGTCQRCLEACPTGALVAPHEMDATRCISYLTIEKKGEIEEGLRAAVGRQIFGCDICQDVCPWNRKAPVGTEKNLQPRGELVNPSLGWLGSLDESAFEALFNGSPVRRAGWKGFRRNVAIAMGNSGLSRFLPQLKLWAQSEDEVLRSTALWAIQRLENALQGEAAEPTGYNGLPLGSGKEDR